MRREQIAYLSVRECKRGNFGKRADVGTRRQSSYYVQVVRNYLFINRTIFCLRYGAARASNLN